MVLPKEQKDEDCCSCNLVSIEKTVAQDTSHNCDIYHTSFSNQVRTDTSLWLTLCTKNIHQLYFLPFSLLEVVRFYEWLVLPDLINDIIERKPSRPTESQNVKLLNKQNFCVSVTQDLVHLSEDMFEIC